MARRAKTQPDRVQAATYIAAVAVARGEVEVVVVSSWERTRASWSLSGWGEEPEGSRC